MRFLGNVLATLVGLFIFFMMLFFGLMLIVAIAGSGGGPEPVMGDSVLVLDLKDVRDDYGGKYQYKDIDYAEVNHDGLSDVIRAIGAAKSDSDIKGISILNDESNLGMAQCKAVRDALLDFRKTAKFVYAYANAYTQKAYYLDSAAEAVYINPLGAVDFKGLSSELLFFKDLQDKSGVHMEVIRHGKYKSAVEPFLDNKMSDANREQVSGLLHSVWNNVTRDISATRNISIERLNQIADRLLARTPEMAKSERLVDFIAYEDEYHNAIRRKLGVAKDEKYNIVKIMDYAEKVATTLSDFASDRIAVVYAQGEIGSGEGDIGTIGEISMRRSLWEARNDDNVKAIVLRIDSPGGNALTSELIWREIELTKKVKPVVVSMGNVAASGGYYIACNANRIFAEGTTITGSIGVFGVLPNFADLSQRIGIHSEQVSTNSNSGGYSVLQPMTENFRNVTTESVERIYNTFVKRVAAGRHMSFEAVDSIGQGRVWSGSDALKIGLVDEIGGMIHAMKYAASLAKIKDYSVRNYPEYEKDFRDFLGGMGVPFMQSKESLIEEAVGSDNYHIIENMRTYSMRKGIQAALPYEISIH